MDEFHGCTKTMNTVNKDKIQKDQRRNFARTRAHFYKDSA